MRLFRHFMNNVLIYYSTCDSVKYYVSYGSKTSKNLHDFRINFVVFISFKDGSIQQSNVFLDSIIMEPMEHSEKINTEIDSFRKGERFSIFDLGSCTP